MTNNSHLINSLDNICCEVCHITNVEKCEDCPMFDDDSYECRISIVQNILEDICKED